MACDVCGTYFPGYTSMMNHRRKKHRTAEPLPQQTTVNVYEHALDGMPQCRHCLATFSGWPQMTAHVKGLGCPVLRSVRVPQLIRSSTSTAVMQTDEPQVDAPTCPSERGVVWISTASCPCHAVHPSTCCISAASLTGWSLS